MKTKKRRETWAEKKLRKMLDKKGMPYKQHQFISGFEVDFLIKDKLVVEVDGYIHLKPEKARRDRIKNNLLMNLGYKLVRFTNLEIQNDVRNCINKLKCVI